MVLEAFTADEVEAVASQLRDAANRLSMVATRMRKTPGMDVAYLHPDERRDFTTERTYRNGSVSRFVVFSFRAALFRCGDAINPQLQRLDVQVNRVADTQKLVWQ